MPTGETDDYERPTWYGDAAVIGGRPARRGADEPILALILRSQVVGRGEPGVRPRGDRAWDTAGPAREHRSARFLGVALLLGGDYTVIDGLIRLLSGASP